MMQTEKSHSLKWKPSLVTSRSEKYPPANTPNDPPRQDASSIQYPRPNVGLEKGSGVVSPAISGRLSGYGGDQQQCQGGVGQTPP